MPKWIDQPPADVGPYAFRILRTPADKPISGIITCTDLVGCNTHYLKNRTIPCEGVDKCEACAQDHSWRWHGYVSAVITPGLEHVLFECTATASDTFSNYLQIYQNLRGCWFRAWRPSRRHNGRVVIECKTTDPAKTRLPDPPNIKAILCHIWNVQNTNAHDVGLLRPPFRHVHVDASKDDGRNRP